jgi:hypothetical protein
MWEISTSLWFYYENISRCTVLWMSNMRVVIALDFHPGRKWTLKWNSYYLTCLIEVYLSMHHRFIDIYMCIHPYVCLHIYVFNFYLSVPSCLYSYLYIYLLTYIPIYLHNMLHVHAHSYLPTYLPIIYLKCLSAAQTAVSNDREIYIN